MIEKLLRSLPNVGKIFVLLRSKKGKSADDRLRDLLQNPVFQRVRDETPQAFEKVIAVAGDCQEIGLGISHTDLEKLCNVSIIFHVAATVRFDEYLKNEVLLNTRGTHEMVKIALKLPKLKILMHVSTAYSNPEKYTVEEKVRSSFEICTK